MRNESGKLKECELELWSQRLKFIKACFKSKANDKTEEVMKEKKTKVMILWMYDR